MFTNRQMNKCGPLCIRAARANITFHFLGSHIAMAIAYALKVWSGFLYSDCWEKNVRHFQRLKLTHHPPVKFFISEQQAILFIRVENEIHTSNIHCSSDHKWTHWSDSMIPHKSTQLTNVFQFGFPIYSSIFLSFSYKFSLSSSA